MLDLINALRKVPNALPLSYSKAMTAFRCPRQYDLRYRQKLKGVEPAQGDDLVVGKALHRVLEFAVAKGAVYGFSEAAVPFNDIWGQALLMEQVSETLRPRLENLREQTKGVTTRVYAAINKYGLTPRPEAQICVSKTLEYRPSVPWPHRFFFGYVDLLACTSSGKALILDYKSHEETPQHAAAAEKQLRTYAAILLSRKSNINSIQYGCVYIPEEKFVISDTITRGDTSYEDIHRDFKNLVTQYLEDIQYTTPEPRINDYCVWCSFQKDCRAPWDRGLKLKRSYGQSQNG